MVLSHPPWPMFRINFSQIRLENVNNCVTRSVTLNTKFFSNKPQMADLEHLGEKRKT